MDETTGGICHAAFAAYGGGTGMQQKPVLLISFYNKKSLGVRYLERSLASAGHRVFILFLKNFNSRAPEPVTGKELMLLRSLVAEPDPGLIGLSVMSSL
jgi:hypothetical protein